MTEHRFVLRCLPAARAGQDAARYKLTVTAACGGSHPSSVPYRLGRDWAGNITVSGEALEAHTALCYTTQARVNVCGNRAAQCEAQKAAGRAEACHPVYFCPTAATQCDGDMDEFIAGLSLRLLHGAEEKARALSFAVHEAVAYAPCSTAITTTAAEAFAARRGVCQDYAQILLALCRRVHIAARYVCGVTVGEGATHAWVEVFIATVGGGVWLPLDPTGGCDADDSYAVLSAGRDAQDAAVERGIFIGNAMQCQTVRLRVFPAEKE